MKLNDRNLLYFSIFLLVISLSMVFFCINIIEQKEEAIEKRNYIIEDIINKTDYAIEIRDDRIQELIKKATLKVGEKTIGDYSDYYKTIRIFTEDLSPEQVFSTCVHETGHYIHYQHLDDFDRGVYQFIYNKTNDTITDYAKTNWKEDFAENLENSYTLCFDLNKIPEDRRDFIKGAVFERNNLCYFE